MVNNQVSPQTLEHYMGEDRTYELSNKRQRPVELDERPRPLRLADLDKICGVISLNEACDPLHVVYDDVHQTRSHLHSSDWPVDSCPQKRRQKSGRICREYSDEED